MQPQSREFTDEELSVLRQIMQQVQIPASIAKIVASIQEKLSPSKES